jgi:hypothetical protein|tara:strand:+ start:8200 stop:8925 length:726 start_codon:yes stop_codon:yes gene_type:complete
MSGIATQAGMLRGGAGERIVTSGLVLHLDAGNTSSYSGSGTIWTDLSGNGNDGTLMNGVGYSSANGGTLVFDGTDDFVTTSNQLDPDAYGLFADSGNIWSTSSWFNCDRLNRGISSIIGKGGGAGSFGNYLLYQAGSGLFVKLRGGSTDNRIGDISSNVWHNIVVTWDGTTAKSYLNSVFIKNHNVGTASKQQMNFNIGSVNNGSLVFFEGKIAQTLVYNKALSAVEVTQNYNALKGRFGL